MIKHRFILRDVSDFKVFAAIPVEASLLTWKQWQRPPDWAALQELFLTTVAALTQHAEQWRHVGENYVRLADIKLEYTKVGAPAEAGAEELEVTAEKVRLHRRKQAESAMSAANAAEGALEDARRVLALLKAMPDASPEVWEEAQKLDPPGSATASEDYVKAIAGQIELMKPFQSISDLEFETLKTKTHDEMDYYYRLAKIPDTDKRRGFLEAARAVAATFHDTYDTLQKMVDTRVVIMRSHETALKLRAVQHDPLPDTPCPPGLPFAAYTVEFDGTVVNVVDGCAWVHYRAVPPSKIPQLKESLKRIVVADKSIAPSGHTDAALTQALAHAADKLRVEGIEDSAATDEEKRVVEIVSQMLTERSLNPKADTKIPVREVDPAKAHQTREAEKRPGAPTVRTIKFEVTPPRYLREAAEHILTSPRRAHWVIGHWRNQAYGERHAMRRQSWIKPHIRGLGEASGTTSRVVAPHARPAT